MPPARSLTSRGAAVVLPILLLAYIGWASYIILRNGAIDLYIYHHQPGSGVAIIVLYSIIFPLTVLCFFRLLITIWSNPGTIKRGPLEIEEDAKSRRMEMFRAKRVFVIRPDGLPRFCETCRRFKPDRAHHCTDLDRCVKRMDHFCPWAGGIVSETTMKFFIQFTFYASLLEIFILIVTAIVQTKTPSSHSKASFDAMLGITAFLCLLAVGICGNTLHQATLNMTAVEYLSKGLPYDLAVLITPEWYPFDADGPAKPFPFDVQTFPAMPGATYALLRMRAGEHPWDLGWKRNLQEIMGYSVLSWILPFSYSPCTNHDDDESDFPLGQAVERLKKEASTGNAMSRT